MDDSAIFRFLKQKADAGQRIALVTVIEVIGGALRERGAHMAVSADGEHAGSLSGGCIEAAIAAEAVEVIQEGRPRSVRFGAGSPYIDIRLPCGGGIDLLINPLEADFARKAVALIDSRVPMRLDLPSEEGVAKVRPSAVLLPPAWEAGAFRLVHAPPLALIGIGHGVALEALARHADAARIGSRFFTSDRHLAARLMAGGHDTTCLKMPTDPIDWRADRWTAIAFLFHDHDWEADLLIGALATPSFYVGAMGSRATHARRLALLAERGVAPGETARLHAPIGLLPARDPATLAISVFAEIVRDYNRETMSASPPCREKADVRL